MSEPRTPTSDACQVALDGVYRAFALPTPEVIDGCPCCISTRGVDVLLTTPLRQISGQDIWRYVSGAFLTVGSETDFRYLLPRILDIAVNDPGNSNDPEIVLGKLHLANWRSWSLSEQESVEELLERWFEHALECDLSTHENGFFDWQTESVLCGFARARMSLEPWLLRLNEPRAAPVLTDLKDRFPDQLSAFWEDCPDQFREFATILSQGNA